MLAAMKLRRLDREYEEVLKAEIKTDANKFCGLAKVLNICETKQGASSPTQANSESAGDQEEVKRAVEGSADEDDFGEFQEAPPTEGAYAEIGSEPS